MLPKKDVTLRDLKLGRAKRDFDLFSQVITKYFRSMMMYAIRKYYWLGEADAEDLVQEVFKELCEVVNQGVREKEAPVDKWLFKRLNQRCLNHLRNWRIASKTEVLEPNFPVIDRGPFPAPDRMIEGEIAGFLREGVHKQLRGRTQEVIKLYMGGLSQKEIAEKLQISSARVSVLMQKGIYALKKWLQTKGF
jgi:RNA polymerase sigma factor (sigma-70 family)